MTQPQTVPARPPHGSVEHFTESLLRADNSMPSRLLGCLDAIADNDDPAIALAELKNLLAAEKIVTAEYAPEGRTTAVAEAKPDTYGQALSNHGGYGAPGMPALHDQALAEDAERFPETYAPVRDHGGVKADVPEAGRTCQAEVRGKVCGLAIRPGFSRAWVHVIAQLDHAPVGPNQT